MKPSKSVNSLTNGAMQPIQMNSNVVRGRPQPPEPQKMAQTNGANSSAPTSPICRCRVMYLGSSVPHVTKDGLQGIQEPLTELYPDKASLANGNAGIDSWLSVWSNGILIENVDENGREMRRFFKIEALHYCAAVKYVPLTEDQLASIASSSLPSSNPASGLPKFLPLDSPHARMQQTNTNPPIFASILRRTTGVKVLECHAFICKREAAANALVRCCFHAYADTMYAKQIGADIENISSNAETRQRPLGQAQTLKRVHDQNNASNAARRSKSIAALNEDANAGNYSDFSINSNHHNDENPYQNNYPNSIMRRKSINTEINGHCNGDTSDTNQQVSPSSKLAKQYQLSKSMHQLNQADQQIFNQHNDSVSQLGNHSTSVHNLASSKARWNQAALNGQQADNMQPTFYNPYSSRVPSYPPQSLIDQQQEQQKQQVNSGGTLRSIKSVAANSIASTLLRSKKHAKAMSAAQMSLQQQQQHEQDPSRLQPFTGFHQGPMLGSATLAPSQSFMMPPVPPMFLPRFPIINGSQTMKLPRHQQSMINPAMNFEAMTPKEMKKLLKKSAKYGLDPSKYMTSTNNGIPPMMPPFRPMDTLQPPIPFPPAPPSMKSNKSGTMNSQSIYSMDQTQNGHDMPDLTIAGLSMPPPPLPQPMPPMVGSSFHHLPAHMDQPDQMDPNAMGGSTPIKSILVKPNPDFLKSKAGKKWLKQQKEFKKLLPPHLDGLPIVFGPPPLDALEPADTGNSSSLMGNSSSPAIPIHPPPLQPQQLNGMTQHPGLPMMDSNGFYTQPTQPPMYLIPSGRASTASTLLRYSPHSMQPLMMKNEPNNDIYAARNQNHYGMSLVYPGAPNVMIPNQPNQHDPYGNVIQNSQIYYNRSGANLEGDMRQYPVFGKNELGARQLHRPRKHMVEQSVISLGDENDPEDDEAVAGQEHSHSHHHQHQHQHEQQQLHNDTHRNHQTKQDDGIDDDEDDAQMNGYYNRVDETKKQPQRDTQSYRDSQNYEQVAPHQQQSSSNDDDGSYSSGIYRRGHMNERAFSYSIQQEHKSGSSGHSANGLELQYANSRDNISNRQAEYLQHASMYDNPQHQNQQQMIFRMGEGTQRYDNNNNNRHIEDLSSRLDNQLNLRSFVNSASSRVRSHM